MVSSFQVFRGYGIKRLSSISHVNTEVDFAESRKCNVYQRIQLENIYKLKCWFIVRLDGYGYHLIIFPG